jgi:serine/threonine-protein kinase
MEHEPATNSMSESSLLIAGRYRLGRLLGRGAYGEVYYAEDLKFDPPRVVALKLLSTRHFNDPQISEELKREAGAMGRFSHPNILRVLDFEINPELAFIVTEYASGGSLAQKLQPAAGQPFSPVPLPEVARYLEQLSSALDEAHRNGVIHRDLKPHNILLDGQGRPLLADFGLASAMNTSGSSLVQASLSGTPLYMAPEQWEGQAGIASDIYALAVITFQLITGQPPFQGNQTALAWQHREAPVPRLADRAPWLTYPPALDQVIAEGMAKDPRQRPRPASEFYRRFKAALENPSPFPVWPAPSLPSQLPPALQANLTQSYSYMPAPATEPRLVDRPSLNEMTLPLKKKKETGWLLGGIVVLVLLAVGGVVSVMALSSSSQIRPTVTTTFAPVVSQVTPLFSNTQAVKSPNVNFPTPTPAVTLPPTVAPTATPAPAIARPGETVTQDGFSLVVNNIERASKFEGKQTASGLEYLFVEMTLENQQNPDIDIKSNLFFNPARLRDKDNFLYVGLDNVRKPQVGDTSNKLSKGDKTRGWLTFQVPTGSKGFVLEFAPGSGNPTLAGGTLLRVALDDDAPLTFASNPSSLPTSTSGKVGDTIGANGYLMTVNKTETADTVDMGGSFGKIKAGAGKKFVALELTFESLSSQGININRNGATLKDSESIRYEATGRAREPELVFISNLPKGTKVRGWVTFEIPQTANGLTFEYQPIAGTKVSLQVTLDK